MSQGFIADAGATVGLALLVLVVWFFMRGRPESREDLGESRGKAASLIDEAERQAAGVLKEARVEGREQLHLERQALEAESRERRQQMLETEARVHERQESLERRVNRIDERERKLKNYEDRLHGMERDVNLLREEAAERRHEAVTQLERAAHYHREDAKAQLVRAMAREAK